MSSGVLFISYSGMLEPLGQSQVIAYQEHLAAKRQVHIVSFERAEDWGNQVQRDAVARRLSAAGIQWHPLRYHKRFSVLATIWDVACGAFTGWRLVRKHRLGIVHARSYVPSLMALIIKRLTGIRYLFDMRGLWVDERVDGGIWAKGGLKYRVGKWFERKFFLSADHVVSLTHAGANEIRSFEYLQARVPPIEIIPTCADLALFKAGEAAGKGFVVGYVGSVGTWYLFDDVLRCFKRILLVRPEARLLVVNRNGHEYIRQRIAMADIPEASVELRGATLSEVPQLISLMHAGLFFYKPSYSRVACAPTKLGEFLGCGVPCLANTGVGDMASVLEDNRVGVAVDSFDDESLDAGVQRLLALLAEPDIRQRCIDTAQANFSLEEGVRRYDAVYRAIESMA